MPLVKPQQQSGFNSQATQVQAAGAWFDGNLVRWRLGLLEKMAGWQRLTPQPFVAIIRKMHAWLDLDNRKNLLVATDLGVQLVVQNTQYGLGRQAILPSGGTSFSVTVGLTEVTVATTAQAKEGDSLTLQLPISIGGRILAAGSSFTVKADTPGGFTFDMPLAAISTETSTSGTRLFTNDIVNQMTVTWKAHGLTVGQPIEFAQTTTLRLGTVGTWEQVNFNAPAGTVVEVSAVPTLDTFRFLMDGLGTGDGAGGTSHQVNDGAVSENGAGQAGTVIGLAVLTPLGNPQRMNWFLDNLGQNGLMLRTGGPLEVYTPPIEDGPWLDTVGNVGLTAPQRSNGMFVAMPQAQVILLGSEPIFGSGDIDPLLIRFSDVGTYNVWIATVSNQAGSYRLSRGSKIMGGIQAPQTTLVVTDTDVWGMSYIGPPLIYGFTVMGTGCGLIATHAIRTLGRSTYWMSEMGFWQFGDGGVQPLLCSVYDYVFNDIDTVNVGKIFAAANSSTNEIAWFFPSLITAFSEFTDDNLLMFSQQFGQWSHVGAKAAKDVRFREVYIYEPHYVISGWFDDIGMMPVAWFNDDLQGILEKVIFAPDDTDTASLMREFATNGMHAISQKIDKLGKKTTYTFSIYAHVSTTRNLTLRAVSNFGSAFATFNVINGTVVTTGVTSPSFEVLNARVIFDDALATGFGGNGWLRYYFTFISDDSPELELFVNLTNGTAISYLGDTAKFALIWGSQLVSGADPLDYRASFGVQIQNECTKYVKYNTVEKAWDKGLLRRSAWIDNSVWGTPLGADSTTKLIQQHERGFDDDDQPMRGVFAETGYTELSDGSVMLSIDQVQPDFKWFGLDGEVQVTLKTTNYPGGPVQNHERYSMTPATQFFSPRVRARYAAIRYEWSALRGFSARVGATTFRVKATGRRP